jgi:hypothetical protein
MDDATNPPPRPLSGSLPGPAPEPPPETPPEPTPQTHPRRWFLAAGGALVLGAGAGIGVAVLRPADRRRPPRPERPPADLIAALNAAVLAERALLADLAATTGGSAAVRQVIVQARADHTAHLQALRGVQRSLPRPERHPPQHRLRGTPRTKAQLRSAETRAAHAAAKQAATLDGATSALLASIAACEATHAELLR